VNAIKQEGIHQLKVSFCYIQWCYATRLGTKVDKIPYVLTAHPKTTAKKPFFHLETFSTCTSSGLVESYHLLA
jgi:hypothetical protein